MEDKNNTEKDQPNIIKKKYIRNLSPFHKDYLTKKKTSKEMPEEIHYYKNNLHLNESLSPFNKQQYTARENDLFYDKMQLRNKSKNSTSKNKSKVLTPFMNKYRKKNFDYQNYSSFLDNSRNKDDSIDKKNKLYENQRESFFNRYMLKMRESGLEDVPNYENKSQDKPNKATYTYNGNLKNREKIKELIENINNKNKRYEEKRDDNNRNDTNNIKYYNSLRQYKNDAKKDNKKVNFETNFTKEKERNSLKNENIKRMNISLGNKYSDKNKDSSNANENN